MLRNTGFFRGIDCPFYAEHGQGKDGRNGCNRPYCHFRHSHHRRPSYGAPADVKKQKDLPSAQNGRAHFEYLGCVTCHGFVFYLFSGVNVIARGEANRNKANVAWTFSGANESKRIFFFPSSSSSCSFIVFEYLQELKLFSVSSLETCFLCVEN